MECVLFGSIIFLIISYMQSRYELKKVYSSYEQLKKYYNDILTEEDIVEIFDDDKMMTDMKKSVTKSERIYLILWILFLVATFVVGYLRVSSLALLKDIASVLSRAFELFVHRVLSK